MIGIVILSVIFFVEIFIWFEVTGNTRVIRTIQAIRRNRR